MLAPACAILGYDAKFYEHPPKGQDPMPGFARNPSGAETAAMRNSSLQGGYFVLAARALGLDAGPMSGFDNAGVDQEFFAGTDVKSNFLCNLGYGDPPEAAAAWSRALPSRRWRASSSVHEHPSLRYLS